ncbi:hypothetical protein [Clostridium estertheticum]|uniref:Uncharacterized protein n=1 Tax=Clostridium estertheticum TaxID=238834 RepID=A0AA47EL11_9CLOT|nr:hypothetical protein [Clostridium estertheticum]MBU3153917.1 hypothetical protein [Clostridium estertheticum]WAG61309.1 hypothetical protein LL038_03385 [Clostridium estertheticum]
MEKYQMELNEIGVVAMAVKKNIEKRLVECVNTEYCNEYIALKIMNRDMCSYRKMIVAYEEDKDVQEYEEEFVDKYFEDDCEPFRATELEIFIHNLLIENGCQEIFTDTNCIYCEDNSIDLVDVFSFEYYPKFNTIIIKTDCEICMIELDYDFMTVIDKEGV